MFRSRIPPTAIWPWILLLISIPFGGSEIQAQTSAHILVASTTSTQNSGLFEHLLPKFTQETGIDVRVVAVGTGQALRLARVGDVDVLFVHDKPSELKLMADGFGVERREVMYNEFVIVGPVSDPAGIRGLRNAAEAFGMIAGARALFVSRGDDSGTHKAERRLWNLIGIDVDAASGTWYRETGSSMGATLNTARGLNAYALTDRSTWMGFGSRDQGLHLLVEGDPRLVNQYSVILVNPKRFPHVRAAAGCVFIDWITSVKGQDAIAGYRLGTARLFVPNHRNPDSTSGPRPSCLRAQYP